MGKSDSVIFPWYASRMQHLVGKRIAFLAQTGHNALSVSLRPSESHFFDLTLGNWDMNQEQKWQIPEVDAIVMTRGAYFSDDPEMLIRRCLEAVSPGGRVVIDWGLGDHWRSSVFLVGWEGKGVKVSAPYDPPRYLRSVFWQAEFERHPQAAQFNEWISPMGYHGSLTGAVMREVPRIASSPQPVMWDAVALWPDSPQLYVLTEFAA